MEGRNILRNRKTHEVYIVNSPTNLSRLSFFKNKNSSPIEDFIQEIADRMSSKISKPIKDKLIIQLRKACLQNETIIELLNKSEKFKELNNELNNHMLVTKTNTSDTTSFSSFLNLLAKLLLTAKLNTFFPDVVSLLLNAGHATASSLYTYHQGQPVGGEDLCVASLYDCIQGYLTECDKNWNGTLPQIERIFEAKNSVPQAVCITQKDLHTMLDVSYRGPTEFSTNCTINQSIAAGNVKIMATHVDSTTCNSMKDSLIELTKNCSLPPSPAYYPPSNPSSPTSKEILAVAMGITLPIVLMTAFLLFMYHRHNRQQQALNSQNEKTYHTMNV